MSAMDALFGLDHSEGARRDAAAVISTFTLDVASAAVCGQDHIFDGRLNPRCPGCDSPHWEYLSRFGLGPVVG